MEPRRRRCTIFLNRPMKKIVSPTATFSTFEPIGSRLRELRHHLLVVQDRAGDQVREVGDEQP